MPFLMVYRAMRSLGPQNSVYTYHNAYIITIIL